MDVMRSPQPAHPVAGAVKSVIQQVLQQKQRTGTRQAMRNIEQVVLLVDPLEQRQGGQPGQLVRALMQQAQCGITQRVGQTEDPGLTLATPIEIFDGDDRQKQGRERQQDQVDIKMHRRLR